MDINWAFQQENARLQIQNAGLQIQYVRLQSQNADLKKEIEKMKVEKIAAEKMKELIASYGTPKDEEGPRACPLTKAQTSFVRAHGLDYARVYRLAKKYESGFDAIEEILEADGYEFKRVI